MACCPRFFPPFDLDRERLLLAVDDALECFLLALLVVEESAGFFAEVSVSATAAICTATQIKPQRPAQRQPRIEDTHDISVFTKK